MADQALTASHPPKVAAPGEPSTRRLGTILHVQWALALACAYLVLFGRESGDALGVGPLVVAGFLATNLVIGRVKASALEGPLLGLAIAIVDAVLIVASLYVAGQLSVELVLLCLGILILAIAGLRIGPIAVATLALTGAYLGIVWFTGGGTLWRSSVLLRVPLLFTAAIVYAWLVEIGSGSGAASDVETAKSPADALREEAVTQWEAIVRCQTALRAGAMNELEASLLEIATQNQAIRMRIAGLH